MVLLYTNICFALARTAKPASTKRPKGSANVITESVNRADLERRLDFRHSDMQIMTMSHSLPEDIFNDSTCDRYIIFL